MSCVYNHANPRGMQTFRCAATMHGQQKPLRAHVLHHQRGCRASFGASAALAPLHRIHGAGLRHLRGQYLLRPALAGTGRPAIPHHRGGSRRGAVCLADRLRRRAAAARTAGRSVRSPHRHPDHGGAAGAGAAGGSVCAQRGAVGRGIVRHRHAVIHCPADRSNGGAPRAAAVARQGHRPGDERAAGRHSGRTGTGRRYCRAGELAGRVRIRRRRQHGDGTDAVASLAAPARRGADGPELSVSRRIHHGTVRKTP
ncbi:hypothetical protein GALL_464540 [mine drainage metagenome]|uniref:Uncharacterized protein n=1 Tax=mine drainage metagenome TaxID=410659 RepID=A0A1J5PVT6_9ZZZZ